MATRRILFGLIFLSSHYFNVHCQMGGMMSMMTMIPNMVNDMRESQARAQLTRIVKFVVGETATPSPAMVNFAVIAGASPTTQAEKDAYLEMMKQIARKTPEVVDKFTKVENGTANLDEQGLDMQITNNAMQYESAVNARRARKLQEEERQRQLEMDMIRMNQLHELSMMGIIGESLNNTAIRAPLQDPFFDPLFGGLNTATDPLFGYDVHNTQIPFADFSTVNQQTAQAAPTTNNANSQTGANSQTSETISLLDIFRAFDQNLNQQQNGNHAIPTSG